jgi:hypothetical protein
MLNPYLVFLMALLAAVVYVLLGLVLKQRRALRLVGMFLMALLFFAAALWTAHTLLTYKWYASVNGSTLVILRSGQDYRGPLFEVDMAPEVLVGKFYSPWLKIVYRYGGYDYPWGLESNPPQRLVWENKGKCWIERYGTASDPRGFAIQKSASGGWVVAFIHVRPTQSTHSTAPMLLGRPNQPVPAPSSFPIR